MSRSHASGCVKSRTDACIRDCESTQNDIRRATEHEVMRSITEGEGKASSMTTKNIIKSFWWRCAYGTHPFSSRTRRLRRKRPMVLCWRRHGRVGGCQIKTKISREALYIETSSYTDVHIAGFTSD